MHSDARLIMTDRSSRDSWSCCVDTLCPHGRHNQKINRRRAAQIFPLYQRLLCCGQPLLSTGPGDVWRVDWPGVTPDFPLADRQAETALEHPALYTGAPCSVHFLLPTRGASLGTFSTGPVDSPNIPPSCPTVLRSVPSRECPRVSKTYAFCDFA
jgi:hypothetical protein